MSNYSGVYVARLDNVSINHGRALVQINLAAGFVAEILRAWVSFSATTSVATEVAIGRRTTAGTVTSFTPVQLQGGAATTATAGVNASVDSTAGAVLWREFCNQQGNWLYLPVPEERISIPPSGRVALYFPTAPSAVNVSAGIVWGEIG